MRKIAIVTDSNSSMTQEEGKKLGVYVVPMPFFIDGDLYFEDINLSQEEFYQKLENDAEISTSQPSPADLLEKWDELLETHDELVYLPMSSGLSASCQTAMGLAQDYQGRVQVVDNQRISVTLRQAVLDALYLVEQGKSAAEIKEILEKEKFESSIYITLETLHYLKKGGRITPAAAALGTILNLKPVLQIQGERLDAFSKARGKNKAKKIMIDAIKKDLEGRFAEYHKQGLMVMQAAYTGNPEEGEAWKKEIMEEFPDMECYMAPLSLSIACHLGAGALGIGCTKKVQ